MRLVKRKIGAGRRAAKLESPAAAEPHGRAMVLTAEQRRALSLLARVGTTGITEALLLANGFTVEMLKGLIRDGLATAKLEAIHIGRRSIENIRIQITAAGHGALGN
jgi:hypothetical protein